MRILLWYAHGSYVNALVRGPHEYLLVEHPQPTMPWPSGVRLVDAAALRAEPPDLVVVQRLEEIELCRSTLGLDVPRQVPAVFLEHNVPKTDVPTSRHPLADLDEWLVVHVTHFNALMWDCGRTPTTMVPHGVPDPGQRYRGDVDRCGFVANEPVRRWRVTGADLLPAVAGEAGVDAYGIDAERLVGRHPGLDVAYGGNLSLDELHHALARNRIYLHLNRWTSLGLSLLEAMHLGMPAVVLAATEAATLPDEIGAVSTDVGYLRRRVAELMADPDQARYCGQVARDLALGRYGLRQFLERWDQVFDDCVGRGRRS